jgi:hypothetical protein
MPDQLVEGLKRLLKNCRTVSQTSQVASTNADIGIMLTGTELGYLGGILGFAGGVFGTYLSIKNTKGPQEKRFMIKVSIITWIALLVFLGLLIGLPAPHGIIMWLPYGIFLPFWIRHINNKQQAIRLQEGS